MMRIRIYLALILCALVSCTSEEEDFYPQNPPKGSDYYQVHFPLILTSGPHVNIHTSEISSSLYLYFPASGGDFKFQLSDNAYIRDKGVEKVKNYLFTIDYVWTKKDHFEYFMENPGEPFSSAFVPKEQVNKDEKSSFSWNGLSFKTGKNNFQLKLQPNKSGEEKKVDVEFLPDHYRKIRFQLIQPSL